jgi:hypothetical protein
MMTMSIRALRSVTCSCDEWRSIVTLAFLAVDAPTSCRPIHIVVLLKVHIIIRERPAVRRLLSEGNERAR